MQRINFSQEERERYRKQRMAEFEASVNELVSTWEEKPEKLVEYLRFKISSTNIASETPC